MKKRKLIGLVTLFMSLSIAGCFGTKPGGDGGGGGGDEVEYLTTKEGHYRIVNGAKGELEAHTLVESDGDKQHVPKEPTCENVGRSYKQCTICKRFVDEVVSPLGHDWVNQASGENAATCTSDGVIDMKCSRCDKTKQDPGGKALGHLLTPVDTGVDGITKGRCTRNGCTGGEVILDVSKASGWNKSTTKMNGKSSPDNQSTWNVSGIVEDGVYDIQIEGLMTYTSHGNRKWYNMAKAALCIDNQVEETATSDPDTTAQDDYRYYFKVNNSTVINPTIKESWTDLGFEGENDEGSPIYGDICKNVSISGATSFSLMHGNIGYSMIVSKVKLIKH